MSDEAGKRILVVEDEAHLAAGVKINLELEGFVVDVAGTARAASALLVAPPGYDAIILDVMLPDLDGFELCRRVRAAGDHTPILMLTARGAGEDRVTGLEAGADDYIVKPFALDELIARVRSVLRRRAWDRPREEEPVEMLSFGKVRADFRTHEVTVAGEPVKLTSLELDLLRYFGQHQGRVLSRKELLERVWGLRDYPHTRTVDNFILRLRRLFEPDAERPVYFVSVRGAGYRFLPQRGREKD